MGGFNYDFFERNHIINKSNSHPSKTPGSLSKIVKEKNNARLMNEQFIPVFTVNRFPLIMKLENLKCKFGILAPSTCSDNFLKSLRSMENLYFIDSGVFESQKHPWYYQLDCKFENNRWIRAWRLADEQLLRQTVKNFLDRCNRFSPDYVFAPDVIGEPLLSLHLARIAWEEFWQQPRTYALIGVVQVGAVLYNWQQTIIPQKDSLLPHYQSPKSFLASLISVYREIGYQYIALGGLLKVDTTRPMGFKFGLSTRELDELLAWSRPDFVLGGLALSRLEVLKKHRVAADSSNWLWWDGRYDYQRFGDRNALQEVVT